MIFISKRSIARGDSSGKEACLSIVGLILVFGLICGLGGLIYGLVQHIPSGTIGGATVLGVSLLLTIMFIFMIIFCFKNNNNVDSNVNNQEQHHHCHPKQNRQMRNENSLQEITTVSTTQPNDQIILSSAPVGLNDSTNYGYGKQAVQSPSMTSTFAFLNQSQTSTNSNNLRQYNSNRH